MLPGSLSVRATTHTGEHRAVAEQVWSHTVCNHVIQHLQRALGVPDVDVPEESRKTQVRSPAAGQKLSLNPARDEPQDLCL